MSRATHGKFKFPREPADTHDWMNSPLPSAESAPEKRTDIDPQGSQHKGAAGAFEQLLRKFKTAVHAATLLPMYALGAVLVGLALVPGVAVFQVFLKWTGHLAPWIHYPAMATAVALGYFLYGFSLILIVPAVNRVLVGKLKPWRGPYYSLETVRWYIHNSLTYLVRYTFLEFITPTPFNLLFYRLMGMKIGRGAQINSSHLSDPSLIELGDRVTVGGSATIIAHYGVGGYLIIAPVKIGKGATLGLRSIVMGGAEIGEFAKIMPNSVVLPKTKIPAGETWGGVPARKYEHKKSA